MTGDLRALIAERPRTSMAAPSSCTCTRTALVFNDEERRDKKLGEPQCGAGLPVGFIAWNRRENQTIFALLLRSTRTMPGAQHDTRGAMSEDSQRRMAEPTHPPDERTVARAGALLDFKFIRTQVPIGAVARKLGMDVLGDNVARCWRHDDRNPSLSLFKKRNVAKCHVCDSFSFSNIDLVMMFFGWEGKEGMLRAAAWIAQRFDVRTIPKYARLASRKPTAVGRAGRDLLADLLTSGSLSEISYAARLATMALVALVEDGPRRISYGELLRRSGVRSKTQVAEAVRFAARIGLVERQLQPRDGVIKGTTMYRLTADSERFLAHLASCSRRQREQAAVEAEQQNARREERRKACRTQRLHQPTAPIIPDPPEPEATYAEHEFRIRTMEAPQVAPRR